MKHDTYSGWGRVLKATGDIARPEKAATPRPIAPAIGNLRTYGDAALNDGGTVVQMTRMDRFIVFDPLTGVLKAEAGVTIAEILRVFGPKGWMPAAMPGTAYATLGGAVAADVHGKNHETMGSFGQHVLEFELRNNENKVETIRPEDPLFRATIGGMGLTGIIETATIQLAPCPSMMMDVTEKRMPNLAAFLDAFEKVEAPYSVGWVDATARNGSLGRGILETATFSKETAEPRARLPHRQVPFDTPGFLLSAPIVRLFNKGYFFRVPGSGRTLTRSVRRFFFPLDQFANWNRLYGKRGFHQFQCVLPHRTAAMTLDTMLREIAASGLASPLAVLKKLGPGRAGIMSFPMEGYTLAVDLPNRGNVDSLLQRLTALTKEANGRIYLAKDSSVDAESLRKMYPDLPEFSAALSRADFAGYFETDLSRRLKLRGDK
ncbi:FAD-binding oxidoreductase [Algicella marina]|uniref:FAD-binding protein n=1 Tax=Algicella marina TaxID=2683284 RepID=A0A6P1SZL0_9RHOB|nr:FAD-binding oxidoreductase [Algicella marina]QHQ33672.1 FAD-binding protein [Algicella marina]